MTQMDSLREGPNKGGPESHPPLLPYILQLFRDKRDERKEGRPGKLSVQGISLLGIVAEGKVGNHHTFCWQKCLQ